jgi:four helix bundle protein
MAYGSANEVENLLIIATEIKYIKEVESSIYVSDVQEIRKMLNGLMKSLTKY